MKIHRVLVPTLIAGVTLYSALRAAAPTWTETGALPPELAAGLVQVEAVLQVDSGDAPEAAGWRSRCPNCGNYHVTDVEDAVREERPVRVAGFLVADDRVILADPVVPSRFIRSWQVRRGDQTVPARLDAYAIDRGAVQLALERPLKGARPLRFHPAAKGPYYTLTYANSDDGFGAQVAALPMTWIIKDDGRRFLAVPREAVVVAADGRPVALTLREELPAGEAWKSDPKSWPWLSADEFKRRSEAVHAAGAATILRANLAFRQRAPQPGEDPDRQYGGDGERETPTSAVAVVLNARRVLVLAALLPRQTAALEKVRLVLPDGREVEATFCASVAELGAFVVEPVSPLEVDLTPSPERWATQRGRLAFTLKTEEAGDALALESSHLRMASMSVGPGGREVPVYPVYGGEHFVFDTEGRLMGVPMAPRPPANMERWRSTPKTFLLHARDLAQYAGDTAAFADARNTPLSAAEEGRLAWLGVEVQTLDEDLARVHRVAHQVEPGRGALVIHVYPGSPAASAGLQVGDVLLRLTASGSASPVPVTVGPARFTLDPFPWDRYDELPEPYYDQVPAPWQPAENELTRLLRDIGFGTSFTLEYAREGKVLSSDMTVVAGPAHFATAAQTDSAELGLAVRELTFETRRYYQLAEDAPGLVISRVLAGSRASVAGLKPFEIVTAVNDEPVRTAAEFATAVGRGGSLTMSVRRMHQARVVSFTPGAAP